MFITYFASNLVCGFANFSIDATRHGGLMRFVNDSPRQFANCLAKPVMLNGKPHVILMAKKEILSGTELRYDYGGLKMPWRKVHF